MPRGGGGRRPDAYLHGVRFWRERAYASMYASVGVKMRVVARREGGWQRAKEEEDTLPPFPRKEEEKRSRQCLECVRRVRSSARPLRQHTPSLTRIRQRKTTLSNFVSLRRRVGAIPVKSHAPPLRKFKAQKNAAAPPHCLTLFLCQSSAAAEATCIVSSQSMDRSRPKKEYNSVFGRRPRDQGEC